MTPTDTIGPDITLFNADCLAVLPELAPGSVDAVVTDPPYGMEFMGKDWDGADGFRRSLNPADAGRDNPFGRASRTSPEYRAGSLFQEWCKQWGSAALRVLKPGGYMLAMGGSRTYHRLACAVEDAGFEIRDCVQEFFESDRRLATFAASLNDEQRGAFEELIAPGQVLSWVYGSGFPKGKGCLKPAYEPILLCRKPGPKVLELGIDECRVPTSSDDPIFAQNPHTKGGFGHAGATIYGDSNGAPVYDPSAGRWPANVIHDGSEEVLEAFAEFGESKSANGMCKAVARNTGSYETRGAKRKGGIEWEGYGDSGTAARFFYCAKADASERWGNHPTVKPLALMRWLVNLVSKPGDTIIDPFLGSGSTIEAARDRHCIGIERDEGYYATAVKRLRHAAGKADDQLFSVLEAGS